MKIVWLKLSEIRPYANSPRKNDAAVDALAKSIAEFGFKRPFVVGSAENGYEIIVGDTMYKSSQKLGAKEVPCIIADDLTDEQKRAYRLIDNKVGEIADWDFDLLKIELDGIAGIDMSDFGFADLDFDLTPTNNTGEIDLSEFDDKEFAHVCPRCQFKFN